MTLVVVSPHLDDAVLGCGQMMASHPGAVAITVFAGRPRVPGPLREWDAAAGFGPGDDVIAARRQEDRAALAVLAARPVWLDFVDDQYGEPADVAAVAATLQEAILAEQPSMVLIPLGLFHHDHKLTHQAGVMVWRRHPSLAWFFYEDALYRALPNALAERLAALRQDGIAASQADIGVSAPAERKAAAIACYASQLRALGTPGRPGHADALAPERFWRLTRVAAARPAGGERSGADGP